MSATSNRPPQSLLALPEDNMTSLESLPLFRDLSDVIMNSIWDIAEKRSYSAGQTVYSLGQYDASEFFVVLSGVMKVSAIDVETGSILVEELKNGDVFGLELALSEWREDAFHQVSVTAEDEMEILSVDSEEFRLLVAQRPSLMRNIAMHFAADLVDRRFKNMSPDAAPEQKIFSVLLKFVERDSVSGQWRVPQMPKHRELAEEAGVDESVSAVAVANLIQEGVARRDYPGLVIEDMGRFNKLAS